MPRRSKNVGTIERQYLIAMVASAYQCGGNLDDDDRLQRYCDLSWPLVYKGLPPLLPTAFLHCLREEGKTLAGAKKDGKE